MHRPPVVAAATDVPALRGQGPFRLWRGRAIIFKICQHLQPSLKSLTCIQTHPPEIRFCIHTAYTARLGAAAVKPRAHAGQAPAMTAGPIIHCHLHVALPPTGAQPATHPRAATRPAMCPPLPRPTDWPSRQLLGHAGARSARRPRKDTSCLKLTCDCCGPPKYGLNTAVKVQSPLTTAGMLHPAAPKPGRHICPRPLRLLCKVPGGRLDLCPPKKRRRHCLCVQQQAT